MNVKDIHKAADVARKRESLLSDEADLAKRDPKTFLNFRRDNGGDVTYQIVEWLDRYKDEHMGRALLEAARAEMRKRAKACDDQLAALGVEVK